MCPRRGCRASEVNAKALDEIIWNRLKELADHVDLIERAIQLAITNNVVLSEVKVIERSLASWQKTVQNYMNDLADPELAGETRATIRKALNEAQIMVSKLEGEKGMLAVRMVDAQRVKQEAVKIIEWCKTVKEVREDLSYQQKRDFMRLLGLVVIVQKKEKHGDILYKFEASLPELRCILQMPKITDERSNNYYASEDSSDPTGDRLEHTNQYTW